MSSYDDEDKVLAIQPIRRIRPAKPVSLAKPRMYLTYARELTANAPHTPDTPTDVLDISPTARNQAHHKAEDS